VIKRRKTTKSKSKKKMTSFVKRVITAFDEKKVQYGYLVGPAAAVGAAFNVGSCFATIGASPQFPGIVQGVLNSERVGNKIRIVSYDVMVRITPATGATMTDGSICRFGFILDKQANGLSLAVADVFSQTTEIGSPYNAANVMTGTSGAGTGRFNVLLDKQHVMIANDSTTPNSGPPLMVQYRLPGLKGKVIEFKTNTSAIADFTKYNLWWFANADTASCCTISIYSRMIYTDS